MKTTVISWMFYVLLVCTSFLHVLAIPCASAETKEVQVARLDTVTAPLGIAVVPRVSMNMEEVPLEQLLKAFSQQSGLNFLAGEEIGNTKVTLYLRDVSVEDALSSILNATGLTYRQLDNSDIFIVVKPSEEEEEVTTVTRIFKLQYANVTGYKFSLGGGTSSSTSGFPEMNLEQSTDAATGIDEIIAELLSSNGKLVADLRTNTLIVTDTPVQMELIAETIAQLDIRTPLVMIAADILDTTTQIIDDIGFEWGTGSDGAIFSVAGASKGTSFPFNLGIGSLKKPSLGGTSGLIAGGSLNFGDPIFAMDFLTQHSETEILARPRILTLANEPALIKLITDQAVASITTTTSASSGLTSAAAENAERVETGISLRVTPQVNDFGYITMLVEPSVIDAKRSVFFSDFIDPRTRSSKSTVRVKDGDTIVLGGLISKDNSTAIRKVPFLGDIPLLGTLFTRTDHNDADRELIMFITPTVVEELDVDREGGDFVEGREVAVHVENWTLPQEIQEVGRTRERGLLLPEPARAVGDRNLEIEQAVKRLTNGVME